MAKDVEQNVGLPSATTVDQTSQYQKSLFPFSAFSQDDPNTTENPNLTLSDAWAMVLKSLTVDSIDTKGSGIIEVGEVSGQGAYFIFGSGLAICLFTDTTLKTTSTTMGTGYYNNSSTTWTFPVDFLEPPKIIPKAESVTNGVWTVIQNPNAATCSLRLISISSVSTGYNGAMAIGFVEV
jgi:hypothetical protein